MPTSRWKTFAHAALLVFIVGTSAGCPSLDGDGGAGAVDAGNDTDAGNEADAGVPIPN